jgi:hypothetical protein
MNSMLGQYGILLSLIYPAFSRFFLISETQVLSCFFLTTGLRLVTFAIFYTILHGKKVKKQCANFSYEQLEL